MCIRGQQVKLCMVRTDPSHFPVYVLLATVIDHPGAVQDMEARHGTVSGWMDVKLAQYTGWLVKNKAGNKSGNIGLGQHWLRWWLVAWWHQAVTWTNVDLSSVEFWCTHLWPILQEVLQISIHKINFKNALVKLFPCVLGANKLSCVWWGLTHPSSQFMCC